MQSPSWSGQVSSDTSHPHLTVDVDLGVGRITLAGELDRQTAFRLLDAARRMAATGHVAWVLDTHGLHFCDASGLRAIAVAYRQAVRRGATMTVVGAGDWLRRALATIKLDHHVLGPQRYAVADVAALATGIPVGHLPTDRVATGYVAPRYPLAKVYAL